MLTLLKLRYSYHYLKYNFFKRIEKQALHEVDCLCSTILNTMYRNGLETAAL